MLSRLPPAVVGFLLASVLSTAGAEAAPRALLPDLDQEAPTGLSVWNARTDGKDRFLLGFGSAVSNVGEGPLIIDGHRATRATPRMTVDQLVQWEGAPSHRVSGVGRMRYVVSADHRHWHYVGFDHYELRSAADGGARRDRKSGFCLGDRYAVAQQDLSAAAPAPIFTSRCGLGQPERLRVREGISVGFGDYYAGNLEGQYVSLDGLPDGRYTLVHRVNPNRRLRELRYDNNAASVLLSLHWQRGMPRLRVLARCDDSARCAGP